MSSRRIPLGANQNVANSPIRPSQSQLAKPKRSFANLQREEAYAQPPPAKKQMLESGIPRPLKSPSQQQRTKLARERSGHHQQSQHHAESHTTKTKYTEKDLEEIKQWKNHHRARFPKMVFYFENVSSDIRTKLMKQVASLGAREEKFFSIECTHVVTTRSIPPERSARQRQEEVNNENHDEHGQDVQTINPSLLSRLTDQPVKRKLFDTTSRTTTVPSRRALTEIQDARPKRNMDVLHRAREMGKKIWSLDKLQRMLSMLLEQDLNASAAIAYGAPKEPNLLQLLHNERVNGPSDRDPTVTTRELHHFKGPYVYVYDFEEKQKPIMVREYSKVQDKNDGDWPQFRTAPQGRCPFIEDYDHREVKPKPRQPSAKPAIESKPILQPPEVPPSKPVTGKRSLSEMESAHTRGSSVASTEFVVPKPVAGKKFDFSRPNAFTSRASSAKLFGGEPVASGIQPSNMTSAIRSQMISSTAATPGAIGVLSKEVHGLQRKVLQRNSSHDLSSRPTAGSAATSFWEDNSSKRSVTLGRTSSRKLGLIDETAAADEDDDVEDTKVRANMEKRVVVKPKKRDLKPGYCENCQDKFEDFEDHIATRKHRKFADNPDNWGELDDLLSQLERETKHKSFSTWTPSLPVYPVY
ncbi:Dfp1/Him1, central region-domain-containing protein [Xylariales sp. AK1849]|nr:Dfp1/Him1, central region-domain-containing protein [Xylariales sp. AK1849]